MKQSNSSFLGIKLIDLSDDTTVASGGGTNTQTLQPPDGQIYKIKGLKIFIPDPSGSTSNDHSLEIQNINLNEIYISATSNTGSAIQIRPYAGITSTSKRPSEIEQQYPMIFEYMLCNNTNYIEFVYVNNTDVNQTGTREIYVIVEVYKDLL